MVRDSGKEYLGRFIIMELLNLSSDRLLDNEDTAYYRKYIYIP